MKKKVREILHNNKIDLIYIKRMRSVQYIDDSVNVPVVIDSTDAMSLFYKRAFINAPFYKKPLFIEEWFKYWMYEKRMFKKYKNWIYCSEEDIKHVKKLAPPNTNFICIPNGVDLEYFVPRNKIAEKNSLIFSGLMSKFVNIEAALFLIKDIFPLILREIPDAKLYIVGPNPPRSIRKHNSSSIIITGEVKDIREYICKNELVVAPVKTGTGTRNKILQAMALCKPVVSTSLAAEGLDIENKKNIVIADTAREFADRAINMLKISDIRNSIANEGRRLVQEKYDMKIITKKLNSELAEIVKKYHEKRSVYS